MPDIEHIGQLKPDKRNARKHNPRNIGLIEDSLHEVGAARSIVIDEDGTILAGNGLVEAAAQAGIERVQVVDADGETIVAVRRTGLTAEQKQRLALLDNRTAELADWNADILAELQAENDKALAGLFNKDELAELLKSVQEPKEAPEAQIDRAAELQEVWQTARGQLWEIPSRSVPGKAHRLLCGDSTDAGDVARLMGGEKADACITDPPYNLDKAEWDTGILPLLARAAGILPSVITKDGIVFWFCATRYLPDVLQATSPIPYRWLFIWYPSNNMAHGDLGFQKFTCALVLSNGKVWRKDMQDLRDVPIVVTNEDPGHPTPKPVKLIAYIVEKACAATAFDGFLGSGTTMVAAEQTGRLCYGMEIEPKYVAVALERMVGLGLSPVKVSDGRASD